MERFEEVLRTVYTIIGAGVVVFLVGSAVIVGGMSAAGLLSGLVR